MTLRVAELFAGIGAQRMALTLAGIPHEVVAVSEIDRHALASYKAIWGDCPNLGDIRDVKALPPCDLVTYSFPCQDLSIAGARRGMAEGSGTRSGLVWEVVRILETAGERERPEWLLMENVPRMLTAPEWPSLVGRLEAMGYHSKWAKLDSSRFGSAQKRVRAFMVSRLVTDPPDLPECLPNAPVLCLRDVMEPERGERYIRRIPLERIKWRGAIPSAGSSTPPASIEGETFYPKAMLYASSSSSSPTVRTEHGMSSQIKVFACDDGKGCLDRSIVPSRTFLDRRYYESDGSSPCVVSTRQGRIKVVADWDRDRSTEMANRIYSSGASSPTLIAHGGGGRDIKVVADDTGISYERNARLYSQDGKSPALDLLGRHGAKSLKITDREEGGNLEVNILTPRECWRLMGFPEWAYMRAARVSSETQLYNQAGNSIVVEVLEAIFRAMFPAARIRRQATLEEECI